MRNLIIQLIIVLISCPLFALTVSDISISESTLMKYGFTPSKEKFTTSMQTILFYDMLKDGSYKELLPIPKSQFYISAIKGKSKSTIYYYEFKNFQDAKLALNFIKPLIWGSEKRNKMHPERILHLNNFIVIISSSDSDLFSKLIFRKMAFLPVPDEQFPILIKRLNCKSNKLPTPCGILNSFSENKFLPLNPGGPYFGSAWNIDNQGNITKEFIEVLEIRQEKDTMKGYWFPIIPSNAEEEKQLKDILKQHSKGINVTLPKGLLSYLNGLFEKKANRLTIKSENNYFLPQKGNVAFLRQTNQGILLIVSGEHWIGEPTSFIIAFFPKIK